LTVLSCILVEASRLVRQLDPEDLHGVVQGLHTLGTAVGQRLEGFIAQYLWDGLLVYFGYPQAQENDAERAVRAALELVAGLPALNANLPPYAGRQIAIQIGIHTGPVIIGETDGSARQAPVALGATPAVAARLAALAAPDTVLISAAAARLVEGYFVWQALGEHQIPEATSPLAVYRVLHESGARTRLEVAVTHGLTPLVGREQDVRLLVERWEHAQAGDGQVVLLSGEAGIGKSRVVEALKEHAAHTAYTPMVFRGSPYHQHSAFFPVIAHMRRVLRLQRDDPPAVQLAKLEQGVQAVRLSLAEVVPLLAALLSIPMPERYAPLPGSPQQQKQKTEEALVAWLLGEAERQPVLAVWEDLHWADPSSLELVGRCIEQVPTARLFLLLTCRPVFQPPWLPRSYLTHLTLSRLGRAHVVQVVTHLTGGKALPAAVSDHIVTKTDGVPLFIEEMTKAVLESGLLQETETHYELTGPPPALTIPATLHDALMARLDRLGAAKGVAQLGATLGRQFAYEVLQVVSSLEEAALQRELRRLVATELLYQRGVPPRATYTFKHTLIRDAAYQSLLRSTRQQYHQQIAQVLAERFPDIAATQPELLAHHYTEAGVPAQALLYWQQAGQRAIERSANHEAIRHLTKGLDVLATLPETPERTERELTFSITLAAPLLMTKGYAAPEIEGVYSRVQQLCCQVEETAQVFPALYGMCLFYLVRGECQTARQVGQQALRLAQQVQTPDFMMLAHTVLGVALFFCGEFATALEHLEEGFAPYDPPQHHALAFRYGDDPGVFSLAYMTVALWMLGYLDQAQERSNAAVALARQLGHPFSLAIPLVTAAVSSQFRREGTSAHAWAEAIIALATEQGFAHWLGAGMILRGWALAHQGQVHEGVEQLRQGLAAWRAVGAGLVQPYWLSMLAEAYWWAGQLELGLHTVDAALVAGQHNHEPWWDAHLYWLKGKLLLAQHGTYHQAHEVETCFQHARMVARQQQAKSLELRVAMSLSRLWQRQGKRDAARQVLAEVYGWFTEGFDTADLQEAKALLDELA
jgi:predicted ATPase/class 3 adenylate cyclase